MIFDGNREMDRAMAEDRDGDITMRDSPPVSRPVFDRPMVNPMMYAGRPIAAPRGRQIYPRLRLDTPDFEMFDPDAEVPYDRPEDMRSAKRIQLLSVA
jgi:hypothetical protein